jgi:hypothetical protein
MNECKTRTGMEGGLFEGCNVSDISRRDVVSLVS